MNSLNLIWKAAAYTLLMLVLWMLANHFLTGGVWEGMEMSKSALTVEYCEQNHCDRFFHQKMNSYSNLIYFFFGIWAILISRRSSTHLLDNSPGAFYGLCMVYLAFGSCYFHASLTLPGQRVDMNATYAINIALVGCNLALLFPRFFRQELTRLIYIPALFCVVLIFHPISLLVSSSILLPSVILISLALQIILYFVSKRNYRIYLVALSFILLMIAFKIRQEDVNKGVICEPNSWFQGHALWHILTACSSFLSFIYLRFDRPSQSFMGRADNWQ